MYWSPWTATDAYAVLATHGAEEIGHLPAPGRSPHVHWRRSVSIDLPVRSAASRRRTIPQDRLALALDGEIDTVYGYSFVATNLATDTSVHAVAIEAWHRAMPAAPTSRR